MDYLASYERSKGHPLSCSIWKDAVCDCRDAVAKGACPSCGCYGGHSEACTFDDINTSVPYTPSQLREEAMSRGLVDASDTDRPPPSPVNSKACYFCGAPAEHVVHVDMPACDSCKRRAVGRR